MRKTPSPMERSTTKTGRRQRRLIGVVDELHNTSEINSADLSIHPSFSPATVPRRRRNTVSVLRPCADVVCELFRHPLYHLVSTGGTCPLFIALQLRPRRSGTPCSHCQSPAMRSMTTMTSRYVQTIEAQRDSVPAHQYSIYDNRYQLHIAFRIQPQLRSCFTVGLSGSRARMPKTGS